MNRKPVIALCMAVMGCAAPQTVFSPPPAVPAPSRLAPSPVVPIPGTVAYETESVGPWTPKYIRTGFSTGLMLECVNLLHTPRLRRRAIIDVWSYEPAGSSGPTGRDTSPESTGTTLFRRMASSVNGLGQAFFALPPGSYMLRQLSPWGEQFTLTGLLVKEGAYSVVMVQAVGEDAESDEMRR